MWVGVMVVVLMRVLVIGVRVGRRWRMRVRLARRDCQIWRRSVEMVVGGRGVEV
jgi:hypothetical protein